MTAALVTLSVTIVILALVVVWLAARMMYHLERERRVTHDLVNSAMKIVDRLQQQPAGVFGGYVATIERLVEKVIGDINATRQHSVERANAAEVASRAGAMQAVPVPMPTLDDELGPGMPYQTQ